MFDKENVLKTIRTLKGITYPLLQNLFKTDETSNLDNYLRELIISGEITLFKDEYYPIIYSIGIMPKGKTETTHEIDLDGLTVDHIKQWISSKDGDHYFVDGYKIDESFAQELKKFGKIDFDFRKFEYYLLCGFDNGS